MSYAAMMNYIFLQWPEIYILEETLRVDCLLDCDCSLVASAVCVCWERLLF